MLRIGTIRKKVTPPVGDRLAGYGNQRPSEGIHDDLFISGIALNDGTSRAVLLSYDLLGMRKDISGDIRGACAEKLALEPKDIVVTCTHTHSGPSAKRSEGSYADELIEHTVAAVSHTFEDMQPVRVFHYSVQAYENINREVTLPDNSSLYLPHHQHLTALATGIVDPELGIIYFVAADGDTPVATFVNYAAHPLTSYTGGSSSLKITSDYPGVLRRIVEAELGGLCVFTTGAAGNLHPKGFESGFVRTEAMGRSLATKVLQSFFAATRNPDAYEMRVTQVETRSVIAALSVRRSEGVSGQTKPAGSAEVEVQFLRIGEICLVAVPGELLVEPGLEIKWNSPFRKTFVLYNATDKIGYIPPASAFVSGAYEAKACRWGQFCSFELLSRIVEEFRSFDF